MPAAKVAPGPAEHDHPPAGHILAAMIAHPFDHRMRPAVAHAETLARHPADIGLTGGRAVKGHIPDDDVFFWGKGGLWRADRR